MSRRGNAQRLLLGFPQEFEAPLGWGVAALPEVAGSDDCFREISKSYKQRLVVIERVICLIERIAGLDEFIATARGPFPNPRLRPVRHRRSRERLSIAVGAIWRITTAAALFATR